MFKAGDNVTWSSQSQGSFKTKTGTIVQVVPPKGMPSRVLFPSLYTGAGCGCWRKHVSYVVAVDVGKTPGSSVKYYWPRSSALKLVK